MPLDRIVDLTLFVAASAMLLLFVPHAIRDLRTYLGTGARRQKDSTGRVPAPGPEVGARIQVLEGLGYRRLGETSTPLPSGEVPGWILTTEDGSTYAILTAAPAPGPGLTGFYTAWSDGTWLGMIHPRGKPLEFRSLRLRVASGTLREAVDAHHVEAIRMAEAHGPPRRVRAIADVLVLDADYRTRFGGRELRPLIVRALAPLAIALVLMVVTFASLTRP